MTEGKAALLIYEIGRKRDNEFCVYIYMTGDESNRLIFHATKKNDKRYKGHTLRLSFQKLDMLIHQASAQQLKPANHITVFDFSDKDVFFSSRETKYPIKGFYVASDNGRDTVPVRIPEGDLLSELNIIKAIALESIDTVSKLRIIDLLRKSRTKLAAWSKTVSRAP